MRKLFSGADVLPQFTAEKAFPVGIYELYRQKKSKNETPCMKDNRKANGKDKCLPDLKIKNASNNNPS